MKSTVKRRIILLLMLLSIVLAIFFHQVKNAEGAMDYNWIVFGETKNCPPNPPTDNPPPNPCD